MKQDRFLTGILIGIAVLVVVALAMFFMRGDTLNYVADETPTGVVKNYVVALYKKDYQKAYSYLSDAAGKPDFQKFQDVFLLSYSNPNDAGLEVGEATITGENAIVSVGVIYSPSDPFSSGYRNVENAVLVLEAGQWKLRQMPYNYWSYDWYNVPAEEPQKP